MLTHVIFVYKNKNQFFIMSPTIVFYNLIGLLPKTAPCLSNFLMFLIILFKKFSVNTFCIFFFYQVVFYIFLYPYFISLPFLLLPINATTIALVIGHSLYKFHFDYNNQLQSLRLKSEQFHVLILIRNVWLTCCLVSNVGTS